MLKKAQFKEDIKTEIIEYLENEGLKKLHIKTGIAVKALVIIFRAKGT